MTAPDGAADSCEDIDAAAPAGPVVPASRISAAHVPAAGAAVADPAPSAMRTVTLASDTDLDGFRRTCRALIAARIEPERVDWRIAGEAEAGLPFATEVDMGAAPAPSKQAVPTVIDPQRPATASLSSADSTAGTAPMPGTASTSTADSRSGTASFAGRASLADTASATGTASLPGMSPAPAAPGSAAQPAPAGSPPPAAASPAAASPAAAPLAAAPPVTAPAAFLQLCERALLHRDAGRFGLLYRLLWRLQREPGLRHDPLDADAVAAQHLAQAVRRDMHKMTAFVRFRRIDALAAAVAAPGIAKAAPDPPPGEPLHVAWFEPEHHIVDATAPFFARRFAQMRWAILTPERCVRWDGAALEFGPGVGREHAPPADAGERLWLTYYEHIFNPARLKLKMMQKEMPRRYWKNLPEAVLIAPLAAGAAERSGTMVLQAATTPERRLPPAAMPARIAPHPAVTADAAPDLPALREAVDRCRACPIGEHATQGVSGEGPAAARLMFVGEQPGDQEDLRGRPFVGPAGQLFDRALGVLGWPRDALYITNAVKHFKFELRGKRRIHKTPAQQEAAVCLQWLEREIELVQPGAIVALGATAARSLLGAPVAVMRERGRWLVRSDGRRVLVTLHPSALLRADPAERETAFARWLEDFSAAAELMAGPERRP